MIQDSVQTQTEHESRPVLLVLVGLSHQVAHTFCIIPVIFVTRAQSYSRYKKCKIYHTACTYARDSLALA